MTALIMIAAITLAVALAVTLTVIALAAVVMFVVTVAAWVWVPIASARYERLLRNRYDPLPPSQTYGHRHAAPQPDPSGVETDWYWTAAREASAVAELPPTLPMPTVDLAQWGAHEYGGAR